MIQTQERRPLRGGVQLLGGELDPLYLKRFRAAISRTVEGLIDALDALDTDSDLELNGDEHDGDFRAEDAFMLHSHCGPGCPVADPDSAVDDNRCDASAEDGI